MLNDEKLSQADASLIANVNAENFDGVIDSVERGASVNAIDADGFSPLMLAVFRGNRDIAEYLIGMGADINQPNDRGVIPMHYAALKGDVQMCELLYVNGSEVDAPVYDGLAWVPLHCAAYSSQPEAFEFIAGVGANVKIRDADGYMPHEVAPQGSEATKLIEAKVLPLLSAPSAAASASRTPEGAHA